MANYSCRNGHSWKGVSNLSPKFTPAELTCPDCGMQADPKLKSAGRLAPVSEKRQAEEDAGTRPKRRGSTLNPGRGFSVAKPQRAKMLGLVCVGCGRDVEDDPSWTLDPAHLWPRRFGGCDHKLCVVPLCRHLYLPDQGCHRSYDAGELDIHGKLVDRGYWKEMAHVIEAHEVSPVTLVNRLTGEEHVGKAEVERARARILELEAGVAA